MSSWSITQLRRSYPGMSELEIATTMARESGDLIVVKYKTPDGSPESDRIAGCPTSRELAGYQEGPQCREVVVLFDERAVARPRATPLKGDVSAVCYLLGAATAPTDPARYCRTLVAQRYDRIVRVQRSVCIGTASAWDPRWALERAVYDYRRLVRRHQLADHGPVSDVFHCASGEGTRAAVLLFAVT